MPIDALAFLGCLSMSKPQIDEKGFVDCGYCDKRFILKGGPADTGAAEV